MRSSGTGGLTREQMAARFARSTPPHAIRRWPLPRATSSTIDDLRAALATGEPAERTAVVEAFRERLEREGTPLVEPDGPGWCLVTFVWIGDAEHGVVLQLNRVSDPLDIEDTRLERVADSPVHALTLRLPDTWQGSYLFAVMPYRVAPTLHDKVNLYALMDFARGAQADVWAREPIPSKAVAASGGLALPDYAAARGPAAPSIALWRETAAPARSLGEVPSAVTGDPLSLHHRGAPGAGDASPVILLLDGEVWREQFPIAVDLERRVANGELPPTHLLYLDSGGPKQREFDYAAAPEESAALLAAVREAAGRAGLPQTPWIVAGQSMGGLFAALAAVRHPEWVRAAVAQSPSLWWPSSPDPWQHAPDWFTESGTPRSDIAPTLLCAGALDDGVVERCRAAAALLTAKGRLIDYREHPGGHDVLQWQSELGDALAAVLSHT